MFKTVAIWNLLYDRIRLWIGTGGVAFAALLVFINLGFLGALSDTAALFYNQLDADVFLISPLSINGTATKPFARERLYQATSLSEVDQAIPLYINYLPWRNPETAQQYFILSFGFNPDDRPFKLPELQQPEIKTALAETDTVLFDKRSLPKYGPREIGVTTEANRRQIRIGGQYVLGGGLAAEGTILMNDQNFLRLFSPRTLDRIDLGLLKLKPGSNVQKVVQDLKTKLPNDVAVYSKTDLIEREKQYWLESTAVGFIFSLGVGVALIVGASIVYQILYADVVKNFKEYATLKAIGFRNRFLVNVVMHEALMLAGIGFVPGVVLSLGFYQFIQFISGDAIPMFMPPSRIIFVAILTVGMCTVSGLVAVRKVLLADPADVF